MVTRSSCGGSFFIAERMVPMLIPLDYAVEPDVFRMVRGLLGEEVALRLCYEHGGDAVGYAARDGAEDARRWPELGTTYHGLPSVPQAPP